MTRVRVLRHRWTKGAGTDRQNLRGWQPALYFTRDRDPLTFGPSPRSFPAMTVRSGVWPPVFRDPGTPAASITALTAFCGRAGRWATIRGWDSPKA